MTQDTANASAGQRPAGNLVVTALLAANMFLVGLASASVGPYRAVVAIQGLGITNAHYAVVMMVNALATAVMSVVLGNLSDTISDRRRLVMLSAVTGGVAYALVFLWRSPLAFVLAFCVILPFGGALMSQSLAFSRAYYDRNAPERAVFMTSVLRTMFSVAWVAVPPLAGFIAAGSSVLNVFALAALGHLGSILIFAVMFTRPEALLPAARKGLGEGPVWRLLSARQLLGIGGILMLRVAIQLHLTVLPLAMLADFHGSFHDVGVTAAVGAGLEVPFMILWGLAVARLSQGTILIGNSVLYAAYLGLASLATTPLTVLWLQLPNAIATAALVSLTITYMQDTVKGRVGLSTSLWDVVNVVSMLVAAAVFGLVSTKTSYVGGLMGGAVASLAGGALLFAAAARPGRTV